MITFKEAIQIAKEHYLSKGKQEITKIYETDEMWIVYGGKRGQVKIGGAAITINKKNGEVGRFILPSKENFEILRKATQITVEEI